MVTIRRYPHPLFAPVWAAWFGCVCAAVMMPHRPLFGLGVLIAFLPIEGVAVAWKNGSRDTLSEIATWCIRQLTDRRDFARGWNGMLLMVILVVAWLLARTVSHYSGAPLLAATLFALTVVWLDDHWRSPDVWG